MCHILEQFSVNGFLMQIGEGLSSGLLPSRIGMAVLGTEAETERTQDNESQELADTTGRAL